MPSEKIKNRLLIFIGSLCWSLTMVKSGLLYSFGYGFWGPNGHDGIWHLALIGSLSRFSLENPVFSGTTLQNYHLGFDILLTALHLITRIPASILYFQILPPLIALFTGILVFRITKNLASVFFVYFGGSLGYFLGKGESVFWSQQSISTLVNPPFALSLVVLLLALQSLKNKRLILAIIFFALLPQIKVYAGIVAFAGLFISAFRFRPARVVLLVSVPIAALLYLPLNWHSSQLLVFRPFWFLRELFAPDRLNWPKFFSAIQTYTSGGVLVKGTLAYLFAFLVFLVGNMGTRLIAFFFLKRRDWLDDFFFTVFLVGILFPMFFIQQGTAWNTIQFFYYSLFSASIYAGYSLMHFPKAVKILVIFLTLPTTYFTLKHYLPSRPPAKLSLAEISALAYLSHLPPGVVYTLPYDSDKAAAAQSNPPRPLYLYESTAYVAAYSGHPVFLADTVNLNITGFDWQSRLRLPQPSDQIKYYYLTEDKPLPGTHLVYSNSEIYLYATD